MTMNKASSLIDQGRDKETKLEFLTKKTTYTNKLLEKTTFKK
jgi:hypothetical protein